MGKWTQAKRIELLAAGREQWGCGGTHVGRRHMGKSHPDCPPYPHHHHDDLCAYPTREECAAAGVPYRTPDEWRSRARQKR